MRFSIAVIPLVLFAALAGVFLLNIDKDASVVPSVLIDKPAPEFSLPPLPGREKGLSRADLTQGEVSVLNVFASWCIPCRAEHPLIKRLSREANVPVYGLNYKEKAPEDGVKWLDELGDPYAAVGMDLSGRTGIDFGVYGVPETFIIDGNGQIRYKHVGPVTVEVLEKVLLPKIAEIKG
ncbi:MULTISPECIES: DsbE family thiol:disulfide interchange protein [Thalassospira]|jgi:cytochrome c biogenesis protein CcmG/thiol:disulfide interchange protein DsbE|uniref:Thiol:disulfide oxidoreductase DsbE n=1 Tax=Thalassospira profundimaris TaxID=502049 RepID=A0A367VJ63_9PROT|nr:MULTISPECIES: DsbE family thiol:disulfide interchange protein [Thalassospira]MBR9899244.1 DsbE family thiol:disulfide interchange protein [Rhodospirillales bacterium]KZB71085.1 disulfide bond formation protein DsbE [Thalassospira sp. MCCC 1A01148]MBO6806080.1 DsbE family thiol:disulfide interchange protein [Thalassospira sp.]MBO6840552.1 DsbE family thiol:disulfide interchange protein [Thalassospira sp.]MBS8273345.1 DsbE family thiol:disulfide interchange protein [Thalassospira tepidiphila]|tara:strand:+ start:84 stop:620 length:537 start_codon:yes stop_codon:yes gene_type:complete